MQYIIASTTDAEYMAVYQTAKEITWMKTLVKELLDVKDVPTDDVIYEQSECNKSH